MTIYDKKTERNFFVEKLYTIIIYREAISEYFK